VGYGGRWDILDAARRLASEGKLQTADEASFGAAMSLGEGPDPDLFIRTGGEKRISNFLLWNLAYAELYFTDILWPDFGKSALDEAIGWFQARQRRFGKTGEQLEERERA
jgi:undecaprenyl diphosphate synthase